MRKFSSVASCLPAARALETMNQRGLFSVILIAMGAGWGLSIPLTKIAVSGGYQPFGLVFWQVAIVAAFLGAVNHLRGKRRTSGLFTKPSKYKIRTWLTIAFLGALLPDVFVYTAAYHLPGGVLSILISSVPMFAFPIALVLGNDVFRAIRLVGLVLGMIGVVILFAPDAKLQESTAMIFIPIALLGPLCYAAEVNYVARWGTARMDAIEALLGASIFAMIISGPLAIASGQWISPLPPYGAPDVALVLGAVIHGIVYATYVWLTGKAGAVFASQTSYLVTGFGMFWSMLLLGENYSSYIWAAFLLMLAGMALVQINPGRGSASQAR